MPTGIIGIIHSPFPICGGITENIGICDYSCWNIDSSVGSSGNFTGVEPVEIQFSTKGKPLLTKQFSTQGLHKTLNKVQLNLIDHAMETKPYFIGWMPPVWQYCNYYGI